MIFDDRIESMVLKLLSESLSHILQPSLNDILHLINFCLQFSNPLITFTNELKSLSILFHIINIGIQFTVWVEEFKIFTVRLFNIAWFIEFERKNTKSNYVSNFHLKLLKITDRKTSKTKKRKKLKKWKKLKKSKKLSQD